ncbi:MAG: transglutaminase domain-containing protein [Candidatus Hadarchaeales archaeon]
MRWGFLVVLIVIFGSFGGTCAAEEPTPSYRSVRFSYLIKADRSVFLKQDYTLFNTFPHTMIYTVTHYIPTAETGDIAVRGGEGLSYEVTRSENYTEVEIRFTVGGRREFTYTITGAARGLVSGSGPSYVARLGGVSLGERSYPYENLVVEITGPEGTAFFSSLPQAELISAEPPRARYETRVEAPGEFDGLMVSFYVPKVFYRITARTELSNPGSQEISGAGLDLVLFPEIEWQFSALAGSSVSPARMYFDAENNLHGTFELGELSPGASTALLIEMIYEVDLYDSKVTEENCGTVDEVDPSMDEYLKPDLKWEASDPLIISKAQELSGSERNSWSIASRIAEFVASALKYEVQETRRGALWALTNLKGDCSEFTDLLIALARAAGIPAKAAYGWSYSDENLRGHAWAMIYLSRIGWLPADPTWANSAGNYFAKIDPVHIARCVRGIESSETVMTMSYRGEAPSAAENVTVEVIDMEEAAISLMRGAEAALKVAGELMERYGWENMKETYMNAQSELAAARGSGSPASTIEHAKLSLRSSYEVIRALGNVREEGFPWLWAAIGAGAAVLLAAACVLVRKRR